MVCGAGLYFLRSFKPALARDYDVFFAAIGLLCGGILFFQAWRLDPILQFGQFLLAGTTVFFAYESVRLRGISADQARRSSYFDEDQVSPRGPVGSGQREDWDDSYDSYERFEDFQPRRRRFSSQASFDSEPTEEEFYRPRRTTRAAIPEQAASRRRADRNEESDWGEPSERARRMARFQRNQEESEGDSNSRFGERRNRRQEQRRGSRPTANPERQVRQEIKNTRDASNPRVTNNTNRPGNPSLRQDAEDAAYSPSRSRASRKVESSSASDTPANRSKATSSSTAYSQTPSGRKATRGPRPRDNNSRFDN